MLPNIKRNAGARKWSRFADSVKFLPKNQSEAIKRDKKQQRDAVLLLAKAGCLIVAVFCCRWRKDNMEIDFSAESSHFSLVGGNLVISNPVKEQHVGNYCCYATNTFGSVISREASVQFGCRWHRCEPLSPPSPHAGCSDAACRINRAPLWSSTSCILNTLESQRQLGQITAGVKSAVCERSEVVTSLLPLRQFKCFSNCGHQTEPLYMETKGIQ